MASIRATAVNSQLLRWARERSGFSLEEAAARLQKSGEVLRSWEEGEACPTYNQLEQLAEVVYRRPLALFFLPEPPDEEPIQREFRLLPEAEVDKLAPDTRFALRDALALQHSLRELSGGKNTASRFLLRDLRLSADRNPLELATRVREYLGVSLEIQREWRGASEAMSQWRERVEAVGVFVFKRSFVQKEVSGFCVADEVFPVIIVNNSTSFTRQIFTLVHELGHLLFGVSSITSGDADFPLRLAAPARDLEIACNRFAAEVLLPEGSFPWRRFTAADLDESIATTALEYSVSREVILRRLLDREIIDRAGYLARVRLWAEQVDARAEGGGGNYYATQAAYLGPAFLRLAFGQYRAGNVSLPELSEHLRMKARNVGKFEDFILQHG